MDNKNRTESDSLALHFLLWQDCVERLDTLLLEARHTQTNIIYSLRESSLYKVLREEEDHLWGKSWSNSVEKWNHEDVANFVKENILSFPSFNKGKGGHDYNDEKTNKLYEDIQEKIIENRREGFWGPGVEGGYRSLCTLQEIKKHILKDKIFLCVRGIHVFNVKQMSKSDPQQLTHFLFLRSAIIARIRDYIARLGDHQSHFSNHQEIGLQDHPRPTTARRREQGIYNSYLSKKCVEMGKEVSYLIYKLNGKCENSTSEHEPPMVFHRWRHDFTSHSASFESELNGKDFHYKFHHYVNSSYWMLDRPDLQSILVHEVTHGLVKQHLDNLSEAYLTENNSALSSLVKQINHCIEVFEVEERLGWKKGLLEVTIDLLSAGAKGTSYLYALFLDMLGHETEGLFSWGDKDNFDLSLIDSLQNSAATHIVSYEWYIRLKILCGWLRYIFLEEKNNQKKVYACKTELDIRLVNACEVIIDGHLSHIHSLAPEQDRTGDYVTAIAERLLAVIDQTNLAQTTAKWRIERREAFETKPEEEYWRKHKFPRGSKPLDNEVSKYIWQNIIDNKKELFDGDTTSEAIAEKLNETYGVMSRDVTSININDAYKEIFKKIDDIPWTYAFFKGLDLTCGQNSKVNSIPNNESAWLESMHFGFGMGRDVYQIALDFHLDSSESKYHRLSDMYRLLKSFPDNYKSSDKYDLLEFNKNITSWLAGKNPADELNAMAKDFKMAGYSNWLNKKKIEELAKKYSAASLINFGLLYNKQDELHGVAERVRGEKLKILSGLISKNYENENEKHPALITLRGYLDNYGHVKKNQPSNSGHKDKIKRLIKAFKKKDGSANAETYMLSRLSFGGCCNVKDTAAPPMAHECFDDTEEGAHALLGRYDMLHIESSGSLNKCDIPRLMKENPEKEERFKPFFARREVAVPLCLSENTDKINIKAINKNKVLAILSVVLCRPSVRLDFLARLLKVIGKEKVYTSSDIKNPKYISQIGNLFKSERDALFLGDGGGDVLIFFYGEAEQRLQNVFTIQDVLFQDFQVERTELILTPMCADYALTHKPKDGHSNPFRVSMHLRLTDEKQLVPRNREFCGFFAKKALAITCGAVKGADLPIEKNRIYIYYSLTRTPGRMDFSLRLRARGEPRPCFDNPEGTWPLILNKKESLRDQIVKLLAGTDSGIQIDKLQTNIGWVESTDRNKMPVTRGAKPSCSTTLR